MGIRLGPNPPQFTPPPNRDEEPDEVERTNQVGDSQDDDGQVSEATRNQPSDPGPAARAEISAEGRALATQQAEAPQAIAAAAEPAQLQRPEEPPAEPPVEPPVPEEEPNQPTGL